MTNKEKALMLVWEHWNCNKSEDKKFTFFEFIDIDRYYYLLGFWESVEHAKLTASKIAEYNPEEGRMLLEELNKF